jgi:hypothetical protein
MPDPESLPMRALFLLPLFLLASSAAQAADHFTDGSWNGAAQYDRNGDFQRCSMTGEFMPGEYVTFSSAPDGSLVVTLIDKHVALQAGRAAPVQITSDELPPLASLITNYNSNSAGMTFENPGPIYQRLRVASWVAINPAHGQPMVYPLNLVNRGLQRLLACTMRGLGFANYGTQAVGDPFGAGIPYPGDTADTQAVGHGPSRTPQFHPIDQATLTMLANRLMTRAGIADGRILSAAQRQDLATGYPLVWVTPDQTGGALMGYEFTAPHAPMPYLVGMTGTLTLFNDADSCPGVFGSRIEDLTVKAGFPARRIHTSCRGPDSGSTYVADYMIFAPDQNRLIKLAVATRGLDQRKVDGEAPHSDALLAAALQTLKNTAVE